VFAACLLPSVRTSSRTATARPGARPRPAPSILPCHADDSDPSPAGGQHRAPQAIAYLLYNASTGYNCAVTVVTGEQIGNPVSVGIRAQGGTWIKDSGNYNSYAGPVRVKAAGKCVQYSGSTRWWSSSSPYTDEYTSPLGWCG
jgi:hypothetical protein